MYGGRVLKHGKTLGDYNIVEDVTILYMKHKGGRSIILLLLLLLLLLL